MSASRLLFQIPESVIARHPAPEWWFEGVAPNRFLKIFVHPNEYKPTRTVEGEAYIHTASGVFAPPRTFQYSFTANIVAAQASMLYFLERIGIISGTSGYYSHNPIVLLDYVRPEDGEIFTRRVGRINGIVESGGMILSPFGQLCQSGFELTFIEAYKRRGI